MAIAEIILYAKNIFPQYISPVRSRDGGYFFRVRRLYFDPRGAVV